MGVLLGLLAALGYGVSDYFGGIGSRRAGVVAVAGTAQPMAFAAAVVAVLLRPGHDVSAGVLWWAVLAGIGNVVGTVALYRGLSLGAMSVVAPLSAVVAVMVPVLGGLVRGDRLAPLAWTGVVIAVVAILAVTYQPSGVRTSSSASASAIVAGLAAGLGFGAIFLGLGQAHPSDGARPLWVSQVVALLLMGGYVLRSRPPRSDWRAARGPGAVAGLLGGTSLVLYQIALGHGALAVVAVLTSLYPAVTVILAAALLRERVSRVQLAGLVAAALAVTMITLA